MSQPLNIFALVSCHADKLPANMAAMATKLTGAEMAWLDFAGGTIEAVED
ncbi:MAG: hypothetical protein R3A10_17500 [Caldilineaceae bacterium]